MGNTTESPQPTNTPEELEQIRRSVAMLPPGSWALRREQALDLLGKLITRVRADR